MLDRVYYAKNTETGDEAAIKKMKSGNDLDEKEVNGLINLNHDNLVNLLSHDFHGVLKKSGSGKEKKAPYIALEYCAGGMIFDYISICGKFDEPTARHYFSQLLSGLKYLKDEGVAHRDLKPENILLDGDFNLKIADFGFVTDSGLHGTYVGTKPYMAPEIHAGTYNAADGDLFAAAIILFIMVTGHPPFIETTDNDDFYKLIMGKKEKKFWKYHDKSAKTSASF